MNLKRWVYLFAFCTALASWCVTCNAQQRTLTRHIREAVQSGRAQFTGQLTSTQPMRLVLTLPLRNQARLDKLLRDLYSPVSPIYRHFLTAAEFTENYGPTQQDYEAVKRFAKSNGFAIVNESPNRVNLEVEGTIPKIESAFHLTLNTYRHPTENRTFFSPDREPSADLTVPLWHISGLDNYSIPRPALRKRPAAGSRANPSDFFSPIGSGPANYYLGSDMRAAYAGDTALTGAGQSIGIFALSNGASPDDLNEYFSSIGQSNDVPLTQISADGSPTDCSFDASTGACDDTEQILDITQALGMAPGLANVVMYVGSSDAAVFNAMATAEPLNAQLSCSWLWWPSDPSADEPYFEEFAAQGQTLFVSAGDDGAWAPWSTTFENVYPAEDPYVTAVGGTDLETASPGGLLSTEAAWSGGGGGVAPDELPIPYWQTAAINGCADCSTQYRNGPDVAANANTSFYVCADQQGCQVGYGGTSFAAPMWAGYMALVNQQNVANGSSTLGFLNPSLYTVGGGSNYGNTFNDVTSGSNGYPALTGYDLATGLGSPKGQALIDALAPPSTAPGFVFTVPTTSVSLAPGGTHSYTITTTAVNGFNSPIVLSASGQPAGVTVTFSPASIAAPGSGSSTMTVGVAPDTQTGIYPLTVIATGGGMIHTSSVSLTVTGAGFTLFSSITTGAVSQGGSGLLIPATITTRVFAGFNSPIVLSSSGAPAGVSVLVSPAVIAAPGEGAANLSFDAGPNAPPGTYPITIIGTGGGATHTATFFLVIEGYDINAFDAPQALTMAQGTTATSTVLVTPVNGFTGTVPLSVSDLPYGVSATFSPNAITGGGGTSVLTLTANDSAALGTYGLTINAAAPYPPSAPPTILLTVVGPSDPYFNVSASPAAVSVQQGGTFTSAVSTTVVNSFDAAISLAAWGLPNGSSASFAPVSIDAPGSGASTLTVSIPEDTPPGLYLVTAIGTGGGIYQGSPLAITVTGLPPDFSISANPASLSVAQGSSGSTTIATSANGGMNSPIALSASGQPAGVSVSFAPASIAAPGTGTANMLVTVAPTVTPGTYEITVTGAAGDLTESTTVSLAVGSLQDFGSFPVGTRSQTFPVLLVMNASGSLGSTRVLTQGAAGLDFADAGGGSCALATIYNTGDTCAVNVSFTPRFAGTRQGSILLAASNGSILATGYIEGTGVGPQINFLPGAESTVAADGLFEPNGVAVDGRGNVYIADSANNRVLKETLSGRNYVQSIIPTSPLYNPFGIAVDAAGNIYIADTYDFRVLKETPTGGGYAESVVAGFSSNDSVFPMSVAVDGKGNVYFASSTGTMFAETVAGSSYTQSAITTGTQSLAGIAVDGQGNIYLADSQNSVILKESPFAGSFVQTTLPIVGLGVPTGIALDGRGALYIADADNVIWMESPSGGGYIQTSLSTSQLDLPFGVAVDGPGNLYIADAANFRVLKEDYSDPPVLAFDSTGVGTTSSDSPQVITIENVGNSTLSFPAPTSGTNPSFPANFVLESGGNPTCPIIVAGASQPGTLAAGAFCPLPVGFAPSARGSISGKVTFTDNNLNSASPEYAVQSIVVSGTATKATPALAWATPADISYGTPLSPVQLNASSTIAGTFSYSPSAGTILGAGTHSLNVTFHPKDSADYANATASVTLTVDKASPAIIWATPAPIVYGTPLSGTQLNATSTVGGSFAYLPATGTVLGVGAQTLAVTFTPNDRTDYVKATASVILTVKPAPSFTLAASPGSLTVSQAASGTSRITIAGINGFNGAVSLSVSGLPSGVSASFSPNPAGTSSALTVTASKSAGIGTYTLTVKGASGALSATTSITLAIKSGFGCHVDYAITSQWNGGFGAAIVLNNTGTIPLSSWTLTWSFANGQKITQLWNGNESQKGATVTVTNTSYNGAIPAGGSYTGLGFNGTWNNSSNSVPASFFLNGTLCN